MRAPLITRHRARLVYNSSCVALFLCITMWSVCHLLHRVVSCQALALQPCATHGDVSQQFVFGASGRLCGSEFTSTFRCMV
jgi:hypothetical protein